MKNSEIPSGSIYSINFTFENKEGIKFIFSALDRSISKDFIRGLKKHPIKIPDGWYVCDGSEKSRIDDANLFSVIGIKFGEGNGSTTFNIPDGIDDIGVVLIKR